MSDEPDKYVDCLGILEIRTDVDYGYEEYSEEPLDMLDYQEKQKRRKRSLGFDEYFCKKDYETTVQKHFFCLVCDCAIKHVDTLHAHVNGNKHVRKALLKKRQELGLPQEPPQKPPNKTKKKDPPRPRKELMKIPLVERLRSESAMGLAALGLMYIHEYINPENTEDSRRYTCELEGCKKAWGDSDDMYNHLVGHKMLHNKNYLVHHRMQEHVAHYKRDELTKACNDCDKEERGPLLEKERDYSQINRHWNESKFYWELVQRPVDWSASKEEHGIAPTSKNKNIVGKGANLEPLGERRKPTFGKRDYSHMEPVCPTSNGPSNHRDIAAQDEDIEKPLRKMENLLDFLDANTNKLTKANKESSAKVVHALLSILEKQYNKNDISPDHQRRIDRLKLKTIPSAGINEANRGDLHKKSNSSKIPNCDINSNQLLQNHYGNMISTSQSPSVQDSMEFEDFKDHVIKYVMKVMKSEVEVETFGRQNFNRFSNQWAKEIFSAEIKRWRHENLDPKAISLHERMKEKISNHVLGQLLQMINTPGI